MKHGGSLNCSHCD